MVLVEFERILDGLGGWLIHADLGLGLLLVVGLSMSLSHIFALFANRLSTRQILWRVLLDALVLAVAILLSSLPIGVWTRESPVPSTTQAIASWAMSPTR